MTRRGKASVVVLSAEQYELMKKRQIDFKEFLAAIPLDGLEIERDKSPPAISIYEVFDRHERAVGTCEG